MQILITMDENGKFSISKDDNISIFMAIGMLELAKKVMLEPGEAIEEEADVNELQ